MSAKFLMGDPFLCAFSMGALAFWAVTRFGSPRLPRPAEKWAVTSLRLAGGAILLLASYDKIGDAAKFLKAVENYHILPASLVPLAAVVLPWLEFFTGLSLMIGVRPRGAALVLCALMGAYSIGLSVNLGRGVEMNFSCFATDATEKITWLTVLRDLLFFGMGAVVLFSSGTFASLEALLHRKER